MIVMKDVLVEKGGIFSLHIPELVFAAGEHHIIIGASGSGKSTLLKTALGMERLKRGSVRMFEGKESFDMDLANTRGRIYLLSQENALWPHMSVIQHIRFVLNRGNPFKKHELEESILEAFSLVGERSLKPSSLSWGQRRKLSLARAVAADPEFLFLDEPFANIDMVQAKELSDMLYRACAERGSCIVQVTHYPILPPNLKSIILLENGQAVSKNSVEEIGGCSDWSRTWTGMVK